MERREENLQRGVCDYIRLQFPKALFNTDMSGVKLTKAQAGKAKMLRSSSGFPDLVIYEKRGCYNALFIELKADGERLKKKDGSWVSDHVKKQSEMINKLIDRNFCAVFAIGFDQAKSVIDNYMNLKPTEQ